MLRYFKHFKTNSSSQIPSSLRQFSIACLIFFPSCPWNTISRVRMTTCSSSAFIRLDKSKWRISKHYIDIFLYYFPKKHPRQALSMVVWLVEIMKSRFEETVQKILTILRPKVKKRSYPNQWFWGTGCTRFCGRLGIFWGGMRRHEWSETVWGWEGHFTICSLKS